jgi:hypothetical protein
MIKRVTSHDPRLVYRATAYALAALVFFLTMSACQEKAPPDRVPEKPTFIAPPPQGPKLSDIDDAPPPQPPPKPLAKTDSTAYPDTDQDGAPDLLETLTNHNPTDPSSSPMGEGDLVFILPPGGEPYPKQSLLKAKTHVQYLDLYFVLDQSASMEEEFTALRHPDKGLSSVIHNLSCARPPNAPQKCERNAQCAAGFVCAPQGECMEDPAKRGCIADIWTGVGLFGNLDTFQNLLSLQSDANITAQHIPPKGVLARPDGPGGALSGPWAEAPYQPPACVADPELCLNTDSIHCADFADDRLGCPGFRVHALRVHMQISDADNQCADPHNQATGTKGEKHFPSLMMGMGRCKEFTAQSAGELLRSAGIRFIGLYGQDMCDYRQPNCDNFPQQLYNDWAKKHAPERPQLEIHSPRQVSEALAMASNSVDGQGKALSFEARDAAIVQRIVTAVQDIGQKSPLRVELDIQPEILEGDGPQFDVTRLIDRVEVSAEEGCAKVTTSDTNGDGFVDAFPQLPPGSVACWMITAKPFIAPNTVGGSTVAVPEVMKARLTVYGDGSPLDQRDIFFVIPR